MIELPHPHPSNAREAQENIKALNRIEEGDPIKVNSLGCCVDKRPHGRHAIRTSWGEFGCPGVKGDDHPVHDHLSLVQQGMRAVVQENLIDWLKSIRDSDTLKDSDTYYLMDTILNEARDAFYEGKFPWEVDDDA